MMDNSVLSTLNLGDYSMVRAKLQNCKDNNEAWEILKTFERDLDETIADLETNVDPQVLLDELHRYNDMKDMAQAAIGTLANIQGITIARVHQHFNVTMD